MRRTTIAVLALALLVSSAAPVFAQSVVTAHDPSFSWSGKEGQQANYSWSSTLTNPTRRDVTVVVTLQLLDSAGNVVGSDVRTVSLARESDMQVGGDASLGYTDASRATQYRIMVEGSAD